MEATLETVVTELMWDDPEAENRQQIMTEAEAGALVNKHRPILERGQRAGSFAYYVADQIIKAENLS